MENARSFSIFRRRYKLSPPQRNDYRRLHIDQTNMPADYEKPSWTKELPAIYVADLADYNAGRLRGCWIEIDDYIDADDIRQQIQEMLKEKGHEEYAIHDYTNLPASHLGEWPCLEQVVEVAAAVREHGYTLVSGYLAYLDIEALPHLGDRLLGIYDSVEDYAYEYVNEVLDLDKALGTMASYFDYHAFARDLELGGDIDTVSLEGGHVAIFTTR